jgi:hypothetical protein
MWTNNVYDHYYDHVNSTCSIPDFNAKGINILVSRFINVKNACLLPVDVKIMWVIEANTDKTLNPPEVVK